MYLWNERHIRIEAKKVTEKHVADFTIWNINSIPTYNSG
jgi:hypothetical protein